MAVDKCVCGHAAECHKMMRCDHCTCRIYHPKGKQ